MDSHADVAACSPAARAADHDRFEYAGLGGFLVRYGYPF
jgi:hypothetical protein